MLSEMILWNCWGERFGWRHPVERPRDLGHSGEDEVAFERRMVALRAAEGLRARPGFVVRMER